MKVLHSVSPQKISWVKSNKNAFDVVGSSIKNLFYPENIEELKNLLSSIYERNSEFTLIGNSSNTLFLPSFSADNVICTKELNKWYESEDEIICDCGVNVALLSRQMVEKGYVGFEGLTDLPGTIAAAVYGNCGCRGCSVCELVKCFTLLLPSGDIRTLCVSDLKLEYRTSALKRGEMQGVILQVVLNKKQGNSEELKAIAERNHHIRISQQPSGANNLGTTINGGKEPTFKGKLFIFLERFVKIIYGIKDSRKSFPIVLKITGNSEYVPYVYYWNRYMFNDEKSHILFPKYIDFIKSLYKDVRLEIEIKK